LANPVFRQHRLKLIEQALGEREIVLVIDDTGDRKKQHTDYVKRQYIGNLGKIENGIVATAYGLINITVPLLFEVYKPKERLKPEDSYRSKPEIAAGMMRDLKAMGFRFSLVLADSLYGESGSGFVNVLYELKLDFAVAIRSNHAVWLPRKQTVRHNRWRKFERVFSDGKTELRYIREIILRRAQQFWELTTDPETLPKNRTWYVMTHIPNLKYHQVGNLYGLRNWVEYGSKNELGWADFRMTSYAQIERWWEIVMSAYLLVSLHKLVASTATATLNTTCCSTPSNCSQTRATPRLESSWETGAEQFTSGDSAFSHIKFTSTLVKSISNSATISRVRVFNRADESLS